VENYIIEKINIVVSVVRIGRKNTSINRKLLKPIHQRTYKLIFLMKGDSN